MAENQDLKFTLTVKGKAGEKKVSIEMEFDPDVNDQTADDYNNSSVGTIAQAVLETVHDLLP